ncbi:hypothetical protein [Rhodoferax sediminis]|uniref:XRE family transcriptional regulator n=1 Tax=Rhodoferax sediminis TaxID=2509614 RepID=A0A515D6D9_9BURK|nr:hypothetical protein [Rhodoferax sediminis]QDL35957.1 hypothetical protein EUB48_00605 [Rhodoferax sediminis]
MTPSTLTTQVSLAALIEARQAELGLTDQQLCTALGFEREIVLMLIKQGTMKFPLNKVPALAAALSLNAVDLLRQALQESSPDLMQVIEQVFNSAQVTTSEMNLIRHLRSLAGDRAAAPIVLEGKGVIALVVV